MIDIDFAGAQLILTNNNHTVQETRAMTKSKKRIKGRDRQFEDHLGTFRGVALSLTAQLYLCKR